jgi:hypothetical protein
MEKDSRLSPLTWEVKVQEDGVAEIAGTDLARENSPRHQMKNPVILQILIAPQHLWTGYSNQEITPLGHVLTQRRNFHYQTIEIPC